MLLFSVAVYLVITLLIGIGASRLVKSSKDFALAGQRLPFLLSSTAFFATWFGAETVLGASSEFAEGGIISVIEDPFGAALCLLLVGLFVARPLYRLNLVSLGDLFKIHFGRKVEMVTSVIMVVSFLGWVAAQLVAFGLILKMITGWQIDYCIMTGALVVIIYTISGGMWAISLTDFLQTIVIIVGLILVLAVVSAESGGISNAIKSQPDEFFSFFPERSFHGWLQYIAAWITIGFGSIASQDVFQRVMSARSERVAVSSSITGGILYLTIAFIPLLIALCGKSLVNGNERLDMQELLPLLVSQKAGMFVQVMFFGALLSAIMSSASAGILAPATIVAENIIKPLRPEMTDRHFLRILRVAVLFIAFASLVLTFFKSNIYELVGESSALTMAALFVPMIAALFFKSSNGLAAMVAVVSGVVVWLVLEIEPVIPAILGGALASFFGFVFCSYFWSDKTTV